MAVTADVLKTKFGFNDPNVIQGILNDPAKVAQYEKEMGGSTSAPSTGGSGGGTPSTLSSGNVNDYLKQYQDMLFGSFGGGTAVPTKTSYTPDELAAALVSKGGYNETDARNAANNAGGRADALAKEFLGVGATPSGTGSTGGTMFSSIKSMLEPASPYPEPLNRVAELGTLREQYGLNGLESTLNELKASQQTEYAQLRTNKAAEYGKVVATNVIAGRVSEQERTAAERLDAIQRQISFVTDQVNSAYSVINTVMNLQNLDYQDAVTKYNTEFSNNMKIFDTVRGIASDTISIAQKAEDSARANLQIYANAITSGNLDPKSLSSDQTATLAKLETMSGLPVGFVSSLGLSAKDRIISTSTNNGVTSVIMTDAQGNLSIKKIGTPTGGSSETATNKAIGDYLQTKKADGSYPTLDDAIKKFNNISPDVVYTNYNAKSPWGQATESADTLKSKYNITTKPTTTSTLTAADRNKATQAAIKAGATDADLERIKTDDGFAQWVIATYGG